MDGVRFDLLTRTLGSARSRRGALALLATGAVGPLGWSAAPDAAAKDCKKIKSKQKRKKCLAKAKATPPQSCPAGQRLCRGACLSTLICCDNSDCAGGRTCQAGTCACPLEKPLVCAGSTICQQCCVTADCTDTTTGAGLPTCTNGICTCATGAYCPVGSGSPGFGAPQGLCGECCNNTVCPNGEICNRHSPSELPTCKCNLAQIACPATGRTGCIFNSAECRNACGARCNLQDGDAACPCSDSLVCDFDPAVQDGYRCRARSAG